MNGIETRYPKDTEELTREELLVNAGKLRSAFEAAFALKAFADQEAVNFNFDGPLDEEESSHSSGPPTIRN